MTIEWIKPGMVLSGVVPGGPVSIVAIQPLGSTAVTLTYTDSEGRVGQKMVMLSEVSKLSIESAERGWGFTANGDDFKLAVEAYRIKMAHLFDPMMAVHTSNVQPLPHQISAVYESMLPRQPLRFVLADDPGSGKTIMAGLLIRELLMRADAKRVMIVSPGSLTQQWQDELWDKFGLTFDILSLESVERSASGNYFEDVDQLLVRLDQLARNESLLAKLEQTEWDLVIIDEAHKCSATFDGTEVRKTQRFALAETLSKLTRHFLLMTATPHNGKEADFQVWLSLLDGDRFYGKFRQGAHKVDVSDLMRRMVKEDLVKFDGTPLFPERIARTVQYELSGPEAMLYASVTDYVRDQMDSADRLDGKRRGAVGFALTQIQRRLASSPEAIYRSLSRRRKKMEERLNEARLLSRGNELRDDLLRGLSRRVSDDLEDDLDAEAHELLADEAVDQASAAQTLAELESEVFTLKVLEQQAHDLVLSDRDRKWDELSRLLQGTPEMRRPDGSRRKMMIFTEHRDTLNYLTRKIADLLGDPEAVVVIHGAVNRDDRAKAQARFRNDARVVVMVATDAAGEGVNLQNANLMINYDLPWNPNRLEQRFGRIHRIGQTEVCHLWNLVAAGTREGEVFKRLFDKIEIVRGALGGKVFDVLGEAFDDVSLRDLLIDAIRHGDSPEAKARMTRVIEGALDAAHLDEIVKRNALIDPHQSMASLTHLRAVMERAEARRLQPHFVKAFFKASFCSLLIGGSLLPRDGGKDRFEIRHVPAIVRERDRVIGESRTPVLKSYERICFDKSDITLADKVRAELIYPAHPLMAATTDLVLEACRDALRQGAILVDPTDEGDELRVVFMVEHAITEQYGANGAKPKDVSRQLQFISVNAAGQASNAGWGPHLDMRPLKPEEATLVQPLINAPWLQQDLESVALSHAMEVFVAEHCDQVISARHAHADKVRDAVTERLNKEILYWSSRYTTLSEEVRAGKQPRVQPELARRRASELEARRDERLREIERSRELLPQPPIITAGMLVVPGGLLATLSGDVVLSVDAEARKRVEMLAMQAVIEAEQALGHTTEDVSALKCGWDITARLPARPDGSLPDDRHIEVKGRVKGADMITVTRNEVFTAFNQGDKFLLAIVLIDGEHAEGPYYIRNPFPREPDPDAVSVDYALEALLARAVSSAETV